MVLIMILIHGHVTPFTPSGVSEYHRSDNMRGRMKDELSLWSDGR